MLVHENDLPLFVHVAKSNAVQAAQFYWKKGLRGAALIDAVASHHNALSREAIVRVERGTTLAPDDAIIRDATERYVEEVVTWLQRREDRQEQAERKRRQQLERKQERELEAAEAAMVPGTVQ
jgi:hypothetical protein